MHANLLYYVIMLLFAGIFLLIPTGFASMLSLLVVWVLPVKRAREIMSTVLALVFVAIWTGMQLMRSSFGDSSGGLDPNELSQLSTIADQPVVLFLPSGWLARSLLALAQANWGSVLMGFLVLTIFTGGMLLVSIILVESVYYRGIAGSESLVAAKNMKKKKGAAPILRVKKSDKNRSLLSNLILKDYRLLTRDLPQFMQFFMFAIMMVVMAIVFRRNMDDTGTTLAESFVSYIFIWFFSAMSTVGLASRLIPLEGKAFYIAKIAPQPYSRIITAKLVLSWILGSIVAALGVAVVTYIFNYSWLQLVIALSISILVCLGISGIGLAIGATYSNYDWDNPKRMITTGGGLLSGIIPMIFLVIILLLGVAVIYASKFFGYSDLLGLCIASAIIAVVSLVITFLCIKFASRKLDKLAWRY